MCSPQVPLGYLHKYYVFADFPYVFPRYHVIVRPAENSEHLGLAGDYDRDDFPVCEIELNVDDIAQAPAVDSVHDIPCSQV